MSENCPLPDLGPTSQSIARLGLIPPASHRPHQPVAARVVQRALESLAHTVQQNPAMPADHADLAIAESGWVLLKVMTCQTICFANVMWFRHSTRADANACTDSGVFRKLNANGHWQTDFTRERRGSLKRMCRWCFKPWSLRDRRLPDISRRLNRSQSNCRRNRNDGHVSFGMRFRDLPTALVSDRRLPSGYIGNQRGSFQCQLVVHGEHWGDSWRNNQHGKEMSPL